jgi:CelD/BcsL family acetyltransferase involved in cellulose biosynthesis
MLDVCRSLDGFRPLAAAWNTLALRAPSPFLTHEWLSSWWEAFGGDETFALLVRDSAGELSAGAVLERPSRRSVRAAANAYSDDWDVVAADDESRRLVWDAIGGIPGGGLAVPCLPGGGPSARLAGKALRARGFRVVMDETQQSPYLPLPGSWDQLLADQSRHHRSAVKRGRRRLEADGELVFRTVRGPDLDADLDRFFVLEAAGWKGAAGTAILNDEAAVRHYTSFARAAAAQGWLRLNLLELDGALIAADYSCVIENTAFLLKTCFDEAHARSAPGTLLLAEVLRSLIEGGVAAYEFLGGPDPYKVRWGGELRPRLVVRGYRGVKLPTYVYRHKFRPRAVRVVRAVHGAIPGKRKGQ